MLINDIIGKVFGELTVISFEEVKIIKNKKYYFYGCNCSCGNTIVKEKTAFTRERYKTKSCGCVRTGIEKKIEKHGMKGTSIYKIWDGIRERCHNPNSKHYPNYGGRGITMCETWKNSFNTFYSDMGDRPSKDFSINRIDNNGKYEKSNCEWATQIEQANNRRNTRTLTFKGITKSVALWARELNITPSSLYWRLDNGFSVEKALTQPFR